MSKLLVTGSGSRGNNIIIDCNGNKLLVDLGVDYKDILGMTKYKMRDWVAAICSHR